MVISAPMSDGRRNKASDLSKQNLSACRAILLKIMQNVNFGRIERLVIRNGEPVLDPSPRILREIKFCSENGPRPELRIDDFILKAHVVELFDCFDHLLDGRIDLIEIKHGLPFRMIVEDKAA